MADPDGSSSALLHRLRSVVAFATATLLFIGLLGQSGLFRVLELKASDFQFLLRGRQPTSHVVLVLVDRKSLDRFTEPLIFWQPYYAQAIRAASRAGAKVFGLDVFFAMPVEKWEKGFDRTLAEAVIQASPRMPVICGFVPSMSTGRQEQLVPLYVYASATGLAASMQLWVDPDDFVRREQLLVSAGPGTITRSFALRIAEEYLHEEARVKNGRLYLGDMPIPRDSNGTMTIDYAGPGGTFPSVSLADFLDAARAENDARLRSWVQGKIVLLGFDAPALGDRHATPFYLLHTGGSANTSGVEIHASAIQTILNREFLRTPPAWLYWMILLVVALAGSQLAWRKRPRRAVFSLALLVLGALLVVHVLFRLGIMLSAPRVALAAGLSGLAAMVYQMESGRRFLHRALRVFAGRHAVTALEQNQELGRTTGTRQRITILFSDIRDFTRYCDRTEPSQVLEDLNVYLGTMVEIVTRHGGEVNKFMGDGIMAIFSDQDTGAVPGSHPLRAVQCGLEMIHTPTRFRTDIGIHTGDAVVGTIGSQEKLEHTALGLNVNLASRLEELNKTFGTQLLVSEDTRNCLDGSVPMADLGPAEIRGRSEILHVFTPTVLRSGPESAGGRCVSALIVVLALFLAGAKAAPAQYTEAPIGVLVGAGETAQLVRANSRSYVRAHLGDLLFAGDGLRSGDSPVSYVFCPDRVVQTLESHSEVVFEPTETKVKNGKMTAQTPVHSCVLPRVSRLSRSGQQRLGGLTMRDVGSSPRLLAPVGTAVLEHHPEFRWQRDPRAESYELEVRDSGGGLLWKERLDGTKALYPAGAPALVPGQSYHWKVVEYRGGNPVSSTASKFEILSDRQSEAVRSELERIEELSRQNPDDAFLLLTRAAQCERVRLFALALEDYERLAKSWKETAWLQSKISQLKYAMESAQHPAEN